MGAGKSANSKECAKIALMIAKHRDMFPAQMTRELFIRRVLELTGIGLKNDLARELAEAAEIRLMAIKRAGKTQRMQEFYRSIREKNERNAHEIADLREEVRVLRELLGAVQSGLNAMRSESVPLMDSGYSTH